MYDINTDVVIVIHKTSVIPLIAVSLAKQYKTYFVFTTPMHIRLNTDWLRIMSF